jgi:hypothetical protein
MIEPTLCAECERELEYLGLPAETVTKKLGLKKPLTVFSFRCKNHDPELLTIFAKYQTTWEELGVNENS